MNKRSVVFIAFQERENLVEEVDRFRFPPDQQSFSLEDLDLFIEELRAIRMRIHEIDHLITVRFSTDH